MPTTTKAEWVVDFYDDFASFNPENWQDQHIWVKHEYRHKPSEE